MPKLDAMKLRASYSVVGNSIPAEFYAAQFANPLTGTIGARNPTFDNPKPETTRAFEVGLDATLFNNKLNLDVTISEYYGKSVYENNYSYRPNKANKFR